MGTAPKIRTHIILFTNIDEPAGFSDAQIAKNYKNKLFCQSDNDRRRDG
jgi:hypothetical protein